MLYGVMILVIYKNHDPLWILVLCLYTINITILAICICFQTNEDQSTPEPVLQSITVHEFYNKCTICLELFQDNESVKQLPCSHIFHPHCIDPWLASHTTCPNCRISVIISQQEILQER